jgi:hypothetical protein
VESTSTWFEWREAGTDDWHSTAVEQRDQPGTFGATVGDLQEHKQYEVRACASVDDTTVIGETETFCTGARIVVETAASTVLGSDAATLRGRLQHYQGDELADVWFEYRESGTDEWETSDTSTVSRTRFACRLDELDPKTEYEFRARGRVGNAVNVGTVGRFRTEGPPETIVHTAAATDVGETAATIRGYLEATDEDGDALTWFEYRTRTEDEWQSTDRQRVASGEQYSTRLTELQTETTYEFRAVAEGSETDDTGDHHVFRTSCELPTL